MPRLDIELTERCDNDCIHCCINRPLADHEAQRHELSTTNLKYLLGEAAELGCLQVRFTGGEPLLRNDFAELYLHARHLGLRVMLFTNARRITSELADLFTRVPPLLPIEITVYGMTAQVYESVTRVPGSHIEFLRGLGELSRCRIPFAVKWADLPANRAEFGEFCDWTTTIPSMKQPPAVVRILQLRDRRDNQQRNLRISNMRRIPKELALPLAEPTNWEYRELVQFCRHFLGPQGSRLFVCGFGEAPCIDAYGRLQPCLGIRAPELTCNLAKVSIHESLEKFFPTLREIKAKNPEYLRRCARCFLKGLCEQCPAKSWAEHGTFDTPVEYLCDVAHEQARRLGLLAGDEHGWEVVDWKKRIDRLFPI
jgi:radical SAM protein with 4Fe4S-binding SPASM domain